MNSSIGKQIGNYRLIAEIASGGFGTVYQGQHIVFTDRPVVALKLLHTAYLGSSQEAESFLQEARFLERLKHPYCLPILDAGIHESVPYLVTEYATNGSLRTRLKRQSPYPLPVEEALTILSQIGQALEYAHHLNIVHRDLKPENILFNTRGEALLADFGIAAVLRTSSVRQVDASGTPAYMAPEQFRGKISKESDQYSLGCIAYELFTGSQPFTALDFVAMGFLHVSEIPVPPTRLNSQLPLHIEQAILKAMAKQRADRYRDISAFIQGLGAPSLSEADLPTVLASPPHPVSPDAVTIRSESTQPTQLATAVSQSSIPAELIYTYQGHSGPVFTVAWSPDGTRIASGGHDQTVQVWNPATGKTLLTCRGHSDEVNAVAWSPDGRCIASASDDQTVQVWDAATGKTLLTYRGHSDKMRSVVWSPDSTRIASGGHDQTVQVWNTATGKALLTYLGETFRGHATLGLVLAVAWSPDGTRIATEDHGNKLQVWDAATGKTLLTYRGHSESVTALAWSPEGMQIVSGCQDTTVQVWNTITGNTVYTYPNHSGPVFTVAWSPDGTRIASGSWDQTVQVWQAPTEYVQSPPYALDAVRASTEEVKVGRIYTGIVRRLADFGCFVEILPGKEGLVRTSQLADYQVMRPEDVVSVGDELTVMVIEVDPQGRIILSRRAALSGERW